MIVNPSTARTMEAVKRRNAASSAAQSFKSGISDVYRTISAQLPVMCVTSPEAARLVSNARLDLFAAWSKLRMAESVLQRSVAAQSPVEG